ncbi:MAG TPA: GAF domain-containing sensor histidine kinase [Gemmatimonadaceae bacterium]|nr:GAF domain-containing sensor histidine kinase [Gemmatimonadaceae bacterium]
MAQTDATSREHDLEILNALARELSHSLELERVLETALRTVAELLGLDTGWVWLMDEGSQTPRLAATRNLPPGLVEHADLMLGECYCLTTYEAGDLRGAANVNVVWCTRLGKLREGANDLQYHASIPLYADERRLGVLNVASRDWRALSDTDLNLLYTIGALVSLAIERTRLAEREARLAAVEERNRIARDLHDTLAQSLAAIALQLETAHVLAERGDAGRAAATIERSLSLTRGALDDARRSVLELRASPLDGQGLVAAIRAAASGLRDREGRLLEVAINGVGEADALPAAVETGLFNIAREALTNVARHAGTRSAAVTLTRRGDQVAMCVADQGIGFDIGAVPSNRFGLVGMSERARLLSGTLELSSAPGQGTAIVVNVPVRAGVPRAEEG